MTWIRPIKNFFLDFLIQVLTKIITMLYYIDFFVFQQPSSNFDDSGFFSIQVITNALGVWGLDLVPYNSQSQVAVAARQDPK